MTAGSRKPAGEDKDAESDKHDEALEESFPASDPPASSQPSAGPPDHPKPKAADERGHKRKRK